MSHVPEPQTGRETRLLVLVVGVAVIVLLLLAQWRFPNSNLSVVAPTSAPLAGLAARATFDEMSNALGDVVSRVSPLTVVVPLVIAPDPEDDDSERQAPASDDAADASDEGGPDAWGLAVRVGDDLALMYAPVDLVPSEQARVNVLVHDRERELMLLQTLDPPLMPGSDLLSASIRTFPGFTFVASLTATPVGPTVQPVFVGRAESAQDSRWSHALIPVDPGSPLVPGALVFSLNSRFIGMVVGGGRPMVVPAPAIEALVQGLVLPEGESQ
jgi:hypothetical protein